MLTETTEHPIQRLQLLLLMAGALLGIALRFDLDFNGLHLDEANYLFVGKQFLAGLDWPTKHYVFSSNLPFIWLAGLDQLFPSLGGRAGALVAGLIAIGCWGGVIRELFGTKQSRMIAFFLFLSQPTITSVSRLATYDVVSFAVFGGALWATLYARRCTLLRWQIFAGVLFSLAVLTKYVIVLFLPVVAIAWASDTRRIPWSAATVVLVLVGGYVVAFWSDLLRLYAEQILLVHTENSGFLELVNIAILPLWPIVFAILGLLLLKPALAKASVPLILLCGAAVLVCYHVSFSDRVALYKHLAYSSAFLSLLVVWLWQEAGALGSGARFFLLLMLCCHLGNSLLWNRDFERAWPDSRGVLQQIQVDQTTNILSENAYLFRNELHGSLSIDRLHDTTFADVDRDGKFSEEEIFHAVERRAFSHIYLDGMTTPKLSQELILGPLKNNYSLIHFNRSQPLSGLDHSGTGLYSALYRRNTN